MEESSKENLHREEGDAEFGPADVNGSDGDYPNESVEEVNEPSRSTSRSRGCCRVRKMRCGSGGGGGGRG